MLKQRMQDKAACSKLYAVVAHIDHHNACNTSMAAYRTGQYSVLQYAASCGAERDSTEQSCGGRQRGSMTWNKAAMYAPLLQFCPQRHWGQHGPCQA